MKRASSGWTWVLLTLCALGTLPASAQETISTQALECLIEPKRTVALSTAVEGVIEDVLVDRGDLVTKDQVLVQLEASVERAGVEAARSRAAATGALERREKSLAFAESVLRRRGELAQSEIVSAQELEESQNARDVAEAGVREARDEQRLARLNLRQARAALALRTIRSPIDGVVTKRLYSPGEFADAAPILELAQVDPLHVELFAPARLIGRVRVGAHALVMPEEPLGGSYPALVTVVDPVVDAASGTFGVRLELPNPDLAIPAGLGCRVRFVDGPPRAAKPPAPATPDAEPGASSSPIASEAASLASTSLPRDPAAHVAGLALAPDAAPPAEPAPEPNVEPAAEPAVEPTAAANEQPAGELSAEALPVPVAAAPPVHKGRVRRAQFTSAVEQHEPVDELDSIDSNQEQAVYFSEFQGMVGRTMLHRWEYGGRVRAEVPFEVRNPRWRVYSVKKVVPGQLGEWRVSIVDEDGEVLRSDTLAVVAAPVPAVAEAVREPDTALPPADVDPVADRGAPEAEPLDEASSAAPEAEPEATPTPTIPDPAPRRPALGARDPMPQGWRKR